MSVVGLELTKLFELCLERLLVSTDDALRTVLVELKVRGWRALPMLLFRKHWCGASHSPWLPYLQDHALVKTRRGVDRRELLYLPLSKEQVGWGP